MDKNGLYFLKQYYITKIIQNSLAYQFSGTKPVWYFDAAPHESYVKDLLQLIKPMTLHGHVKIRIGSKNDGGYVMVEPGSQGGIAYSFGIAANASWDSEMASKNFHVYQYDGTISAPPESGPNLHWCKYNITGDSIPQSGYTNIATIMKELNHENENNIILKMDIEDSEWDVFENIDSCLMDKFCQIIVEFHSLIDFSDEAKVKHLNVLNKIYKTHQSVHYHINNYSTLCVFPSCNIGSTIEVTFIRRNGYHFTCDFNEYPIIAFDNPCDKRRPDIYIGNLEILLASDKTVPMLCCEYKTNVAIASIEQNNKFFSTFLSNNTDFPNKAQKVILALCKPFIRLFAPLEYLIQFEQDPAGFFYGTKYCCYRLIRVVLSCFGPQPLKTKFCIKEVRKFLGR